jgi:hypothetical protein
MFKSSPAVGTRCSQIQSKEFVSQHTRCTNRCTSAPHSRLPYLLAMSSSRLLQPLQFALPATPNAAIPSFSCQLLILLPDTRLQWHSNAFGSEPRNAVCFAIRPSMENFVRLQIIGRASGAVKLNQKEPPETLRTHQTCNALE